MQGRPAAQAVYCNQCGTANGLGNPRCRQCGSGLHPPAAVVAPQPQNKLMACHDCGRGVSRLADVCPGCGRSFRNPDDPDADILRSVSFWSVFKVISYAIGSLILMAPVFWVLSFLITVLAGTMLGNPRWGR